jgi:hypothetical protein
MRITFVALALSFLISGGGCTSMKSMSETGRLSSADRFRVTMTEGKPRPVIDGIGWVMGIPDKLLLWDRRVENHHVGENTKASIAEYLDSRGLNDVHVRVNEYDPAGEWRRLTQNTRISAVWRYTAGALSVVGYTLFPGRVFGGEKYNPYTNSLYVYSDVPSLGLVHGAYAYDVRSRSMPGTYAFTQELPVLSLYKETLATREALEYLEVTGEPEELQEGYRILHPRYGAEIGGAADSFLAGRPVFQVAGAVVGHATGRWKAHSQASPSTPKREENEYVNTDDGIQQVVHRAQNDDEEVSTVPQSGGF